MVKISIFLYPNYEENDILAPVELFKKVPNLFDISYYSSNGGLVPSSNGFCIETETYQDLLQQKTGKDSEYKSVLLIPGGKNILTWLKDETLVTQIKTLANLSTWVLSVCTGAMILAKAGLLQEQKGVTNTAFLETIPEIQQLANWEKDLSYISSGKFYSSRNLAAANEMILDFIHNNFGRTIANKVKENSTYELTEDVMHDPLALL